MVFGRSILGSRYARNVASLAGGTGLGQLIMIAALPGLTRLYTPAEFGEFEIFLAILFFIVTVACFRFDLAIPLAKSDQEAGGLLGAAVIASSVVALAVGLLFGALSPWILENSSASTRLSFAIALPVAVALTGWYQALTYSAIRAKDFAAIASTKVVQGLAGAGTQLALGAIGLGAVGLVVGQTVGRIPGVHRLAKIALAQGRPGMAQVTDMSRRFRGFAALSTASGLLNSAGQRAPVLLLAGTYGIVPAAFFAMGMRLYGVPMSLIGASVAQVYLGEVTELNRMNGPASVRRLFARRFLQGLAVAVALAAIALVLTPFVVPWALGEDWRAAVPMIEAIAILFTFQLAVSPVSQTLNVLGKTSWLTAWDALRLVQTVTSILVPWLLGWQTTKAVLLFAATGAGMYVILLGMSWVALRRSGRVTDGRGHAHS